MAKKKVSAFRGKVQQAAAKANNSDSNYGYLIIPKGIEMYVPTAGSTEKFDVLPYTVTSDKHPDRDTDIGMAVAGELWYKRPYRVHRDIGVDKERYVCLTSFGKKCPICEYRAKRAKEGATKEELKAFNSSQRNLYAVVPRGIKKLEESVHLFDFSDFNFQELINEEILENEQYEVFPDSEEGLTLSVRWAEESFMGNSFAKAGRIDFKTRKTPIEQELLEAVPALDDCLKELSYTELEKVFFEMVDVADDTEEEEEEAPAPKKKSAKPVEDESPFKKSAPVKPAAAKATGKTPVCPHGFKFGKDCDKKSACDDCELWSACLDASENN